MSEIIYFARCPEHGLHGQRIRCFECGAEAEQVPMVPLAEYERVVAERDLAQNLVAEQSRHAMPSEAR